ncbi:MAG: hypothetical protein P8179_02445 [Candidatus Thiodiazotropha sp.]
MIEACSGQETRRNAQGMARPFQAVIRVVARLGKGEAIPGGTRLAANRLASRYHRQFV